ncbi:hypothetical protein THIOM_005561 [Candidatus Thiomargarita nelsonii]|uniref:SGNH hydrolase-type esterase domain-containing protein n=1 Tax=Candidatus Thiomargarita nelsonii TaxID=1003181 RepID=A0A176RSV7_9GAMM|nr:hypothetical protein THIOM_005561 [Candidatus Thiomargarita nelsonii]
MEFDTRTKSHVYRNLKSEGVDAVPSVNPSTFIGTNGVEHLYPFGGVSGKTTVNCNESGKYTIFPSDRYGFNNPDSEWDSSQTEWVLTGDSFIHGACVNPGEDIAGQIRSISGETVINLGNSGNGPLIELAVLKEYAESRKQKTVLWVYYEGNDLQNLTGEKSTPLLMSYLQPEFSQNLIHRQTEIDNRLGKYIEAEPLFRTIKMLRLYNIRERLRFYVLRFFVNVNVDVEPLFTEILTKARDRTAAWGGKLYFVYLPEFERYATEVQNHDRYRKRREVIHVAKSLNLPVIDIHHEVFANHPDPLSLFPFRMPGHYTAGGYSEIAKAIVSGVINEQQRQYSAE